MEWKYLAVNPQTKETLDRLTAIDGKFSGYRKNSAKIKKKDDTEISISYKNFDVVHLWLLKNVDSKGYVLFSDALNSMCFECREKTGHGSQQSVRQYISILTSSAAPFEVVKNEQGKKIIQRRKEKEEP